MSNKINKRSLIVFWWNSFCQPQGQRWVKCVRIWSYSGPHFSRVLSHKDWIRKDTKYLSVFNPNVGKCGKNVDQNNSEYVHFLCSAEERMNQRFSERFFIDSHDYLIRGRCRAAVTSKMECFVIIVNGLKPLSIITKQSILDLAAALDPPLLMIPIGWKYVHVNDLSMKVKYIWKYIRHPSPKPRSISIWIRVFLFILYN